MSFPTEFPREALGVVLNIKDAEKATLALAAYDILGYGLHVAFGDVKYLAGFDFETMAAVAEGVDDLTKAQKRYDELKGSGMATFAIILKLLQEYGPKILALVMKFREKRRNV